MKTATDNPIKEVVKAFISALNDDDFKTAATYLDDNMTFKGVLGSRNGSEDYINDMSKMKFKYDIEKIFAEDNEVCMLYTINMGGKKIFTCGLYEVQDGKIKSLKVVFDPRPVLEANNKK